MGLKTLPFVILSFIKNFDVLNDIRCLYLMIRNNRARLKVEGKEKFIKKLKGGDLHGTQRFCSSHRS